MEARVNYAVVGAFVLALGAALIGGILWLSGGGATRKAYDTYVTYMDESVSGLSPTRREVSSVKSDACADRARAHHRAGALIWRRARHADQGRHRGHHAHAGLTGIGLSS
jgi:hypothetical protein